MSLENDKELYPLLLKLRDKSCTLDELFGSEFKSESELPYGKKRALQDAIPTLISEDNGVYKITKDGKEALCHFDGLRKIDKKRWKEKHIVRFEDIEELIKKSGDEGR